MTRRFGIILCMGAMTALAGPARGDWKPELMDREAEIAAALEAGPASIRDGAGVYVLTAAGFETARASRNGFHCLVERSQPESFEPQCFDAEGSATLLPGRLLRATIQMRGAAPEEVEAAVAAAWRSGELRAPRRPGINYMLSPRNRVPVGPERVIPYRPHVMFYAPYLSNADVGGDTAGASPVFVIQEGRPDAYVIVPVPGDLVGGAAPE